MDNLWSNLTRKDLEVVDCWVGNKGGEIVCTGGFAEYKRGEWVDAETSGVFLKGASTKYKAGNWYLDNPMYDNAMLWKLVEKNEGLING